ncbi:MULTISPECIES: ribonucleotide-diphosphate reductase subunit beta [unclassified Planococcus (in: firmicutes)]|uniref:ribonucleotide-diphosphate reductase subunit beta n=1 Tax=unclassified Planococcus (in: firmicutes) TaxID=2662419 RepID=UPI0020B196C9|nr:MULTISPECIES: ribonucleotide-diphosphate reductase subunit beta [unclassified Planococcus (in: firmicutes)]
MLKSIVFEIILEGLFFYAGFAFFYNLTHNGKIEATSTIINRGEQVNAGLFVNIFTEMLAENPEYDTTEL